MKCALNQKLFQILIETSKRIYLIVKCHRDTVVHNYITIDVKPCAHIADEEGTMSNFVKIVQKLNIWSFIGGINERFLKDS